VQGFRPQAAKLYRHNLRLTKKKDFVRRIRAFLISEGVRVVRIHTGGEFGSVRYAGKWLRIVERSPRVRFFTYTRAWRIPAIGDVLERMSLLPNMAMWYSADRDTGWPEHVPPKVRIAWLVTKPDEHVHADADLVFRSQSLRKIHAVELNGVPVCPAENGQQDPTTCDRCRICWRLAEPKRFSLPVLTLP
jgi:hypothetical protein